MCLRNNRAKIKHSFSDHYLYYFFNPTKRVNFTAFKSPVLSRCTVRTLLYICEPIEVYGTTSLYVFLLVRSLRTHLAFWHRTLKLVTWQLITLCRFSCQVRIKAETKSREHYLKTKTWSWTIWKSRTFNQCNITNVNHFTFLKMEGPKAIAYWS